MLNKALWTTKFLIFLVILITLSLSASNFKQNTNKVSAQVSPDAIAIRILPNPYHYPPMRWYQEQGFKGSPTKLKVDGYNAIQDGRTVYVNVGNIKDGNFYSNIYVISFTQKATPETLDIFKRMLDNWVFNTNVDKFGECTLSRYTCFSSDECPANYECNSDNKCIPEQTISCSVDSDCPAQIFCDSQKAKLTRDTKRLENIIEMKRIFFNYKQTHQEKHLRLQAGTFLSNNTISTWPSWIQTLQKEMQSTINQYSIYDHLPKDPLNVLGNCGDKRFNPQTCWDNKKKEYAGTVNEDGSLTLPDSEDSYVYVYAITSDNELKFCSSLETVGISIDNVETDQCASSGGIGYVLGEDNIPPIINCGTLSGSPDQKFSKSISVDSQDGDAISSWSLDTSLSDWSSWSSAPKLKPAVANIKKIYAEKTGNKGTYEIGVTVVDSRQAENTKICEINIGNHSPKLIVSCQTDVRVNHDYTCENINAHDPDDDDQVSFSFSNEPPPGLSIESSTGRIFGTPSVSGVYDIGVTAQDSYRLTDSKSFTLNVNTYCGDEETQDPNMENYSEQCDTSGGEGSSPNDQYKCTYDCKWTGGYCYDGTIQSDYEDCENHGYGSGPNDQYECSDDCQWTGGYCGDNELQADYENCENPGNGSGPDDQYECSDDCQWTGGYCGDGIVQSQSEECDISGGEGSGPDDQYECSDDCKWTGGYCGDGIVQSQEEQCDDSNNNSSDACGNNCVWTCNSWRIDETNNFLSTAKTGDATLYDNNNNTYVPLSASNSAPYTYLKLSGVMPTPYIWIANSSYNRVSKIRTYNGYRRNCVRNEGTVDCFWDTSTWETRGEVLGVYNVGANPSRTTVNAVTGDMWIANRNSADVHKLDINGNVLKRCNVGSGPRGVVLDKNGDAWIANYGDGNVTKISGDDSNCSVLETVNTGGNPYGLAIDFNNNIWVSNRGAGEIQKINPRTAEVTESYSAPGTYGIAVDTNGDVWAGNVDSSVYKVDTDSDVIQTYNFSGLDSSAGRSRGVTIDVNGNIWIAMDYSAQVVKIPDPSNPSDYQIFNTTGTFPIGICGDSSGQVWAVNRNSHNATVFNSAGDVVGTHDVNPNMSNPYPYTYSDMTGLNRAMMLRHGFWISNVIDSGNDDQHWGILDWMQSIPSADQGIQIYIRANNTNLTTEPWIEAEYWNSLPMEDRVGRMVQIKVEMHSSKRNISPVLWDLSLNCNY